MSQKTQNANCKIQGIREVGDPGDPQSPGSRDQETRGSGDWGIYGIQGIGGISLFHGIGLMCLQQSLTCWFPKKLLMETIYSSCYVLDEATLTFFWIAGTSSKSMWMGGRDNINSHCLPFTFIGWKAKVAEVSFSWNSIISSFEHLARNGVR